MMTCRSARRSPSRHHHFRFEWDRKTGYSHDMICYGPFDCSSSTWIVPGSIEENEYDIEPEVEKFPDYSFTDDTGQVWDMTNNGRWRL